VKRVRTFFPVWFVSRAVVLSIFVADTFLPFGGMESYDDIRFLGIVFVGLGCVAGYCDSNCVCDVNWDITGCVGGVRSIVEENLRAIV